MSIAQWILEITDILKYKIKSFLKYKYDKKIVCPSNPKNIPTALQGLMNNSIWQLKLLLHSQ